MDTSRQIIEALRRLVEDSAGIETFCARTRTQKGQINGYLKGTLKAPTVATLLHYARRLYSEPPAFKEVLACERADGHAGFASLLAKLKGEVGVYALFDSAYRVIYVGKSTTDLGFEIKQRLAKEVPGIHSPSGRTKITFAEATRYVSAYATIRGDSEFVHDLEVLLLRLVINMTGNQNGGTFKRLK